MGFDLDDLENHQTYNLISGSQHDNGLVIIHQYTNGDDALEPDFHIALPVKNIKELLNSHASGEASSVSSAIADELIDGVRTLKPNNWFPRTCMWRAPWGHQFRDYWGDTYGTKIAAAQSAGGDRGGIIVTVRDFNERLFHQSVNIDNPFSPLGCDLSGRSDEIVAPNGPTEYLEPEDFFSDYQEATSERIGHLQHQGRLDMLDTSGTLEEFFDGTRLVIFNRVGVKVDEYV
ncbi:uncharacterized protein L201_005309 [Kwoniella dendrophila CBS 6074]|uniref:Uncharacterized protein n=1 Tax=Kwoniella dendrophila CBS 6074 TaxID=1295534 RepID=A0AAX4JY94_9TREE